ncbi:MAG: RNA methyltransferase [Bacteroidetes bacterium]|nr:RNA methyltransferase [Bacteroidota bacterium]
MRKLKTDELNRLSVDQYKSAPKLPLIIVLDNIRSQHNIGSVFRTADAFRCEAIYLCGITATPPNREIHKTALGSTDSVTWKYFPSTLDAIEELRSQHYQIFAIEQTDNSIPIDTFDAVLETPTAVIFGNEVSGIDEAVLKYSDICLVIRQFGTKHSLNISVAAGIVIWYFFQSVKKIF